MSTPQANPPGSLITIRDASLRTVSTSKNLRGILTHCRKVSPERVDLWRHKCGSGTLGVSWLDGSTVICSFASYEVLTDWVKARRAFKAIEPKTHA